MSPLPTPTPPSPQPAINGLNCSSNNVATQLQQHDQYFEWLVNTFYGPKRKNIKNIFHRVDTERDRDGTKVILA